MRVLVDGYNVTMRDPALVGRSKEIQRDALIEHLRRAATSIAGRGGRVVVVFDAHAALGSSAESSGPLTVVYAASADDEIVRRCERAGQAVAVYTDDLRLRMRISQDVGRHVEYRDVASLMTRTAAGPSGRDERSRGPAADKGLPRSAREDITAELEGLWLDDEE